ncbi:MAG: hypothetical protein MUE97_06065 [Phycisphaerales bacterium]|jgi:uncharacterized membrane protein AbrB (regulator of aidB expression)|nr:hypothetical protein [Phycisphaerales bacterium]
MLKHRDVISASRVAICRVLGVLLLGWIVLGFGSVAMAQSGTGTPPGAAAVGMASMAQGSSASGGRGVRLGCPSRRAA